jgi:hypothetical protein
MKYCKIYSLVISFFFLIFGIFLYIKWYFNCIELMCVCSEILDFEQNNNLENYNKRLLNNINDFFTYENGLKVYLLQYYQIYLLVFSELSELFNLNKFKSYIFFSNWRLAIPFCTNTFCNINFSKFSFSFISDLYFYKFLFSYDLFLKQDFTFFLYYFYDKYFESLYVHINYNQILINTYLCFFLEFFFFFNISVQNFIELLSFEYFLGLETANSYSKNLFNSFNFNNNLLFFFNYNNTVLLQFFNNEFFWNKILYNNFFFFDNLVCLYHDLSIQLISIQENFFLKQLFKNCFFLLFLIILKFNLYNINFFDYNEYTYYYEFLLLLYFNFFKKLSYVLTISDEIEILEFFCFFVFQLAALAQESEIEQNFTYFTELLIYLNSNEILLDNLLFNYTICLLNYQKLLFFYLETFLVTFFNTQTFFIFGFDSFSFIFFLLTVFIFPLCFLLIWKIEIEILLLVLILFSIEFLLIGVFTSLDLISFYVCFEAILVPMTILILNWGSRGRKIKALYYFFLYTLVTSLIMLLAIILIYFFYGTLIFNELFYINELKQLTFINKIIWLFFLLLLLLKFQCILFIFGYQKHM